LHPEEIDDGGWFSLSRVARWVEERPGDFAAGFLLVWKRWTAAGFDKRAAHPSSSGA
jgi:hypothetical protein